VKTFRWLTASAIALAAAPLTAASMGSFSPTRLSAIDKTLSSDAFQGRGTASAVEPTVINYIAQQFAAAGVQPGGDVVNHLPPDCLSVYVPTTPNPTGGYFVIVRRDQVIELDMSVDQALKYIISMGVVPPLAKP